MNCLNLASVSIKWLGLTDYNLALAYQEQYADLVREKKITPLVVGLEHPAVVTLGKRGLQSQDVVENCPLPVVTIDRGGQATLHQPGQLVIYPIIPIQELQIEVKEYVQLLEQATIKTLGQLNIVAFQADQPGIYTKLGKIGFIGVRIDRGVTRHGISINVSNDLGEFQYIRACGMTQAMLTRTRDLGSQASTEDLFHLWTEQFLTIANDLISSKTERSSLFEETMTSSLGVVGSAFP